MAKERVPRRTIDGHTHIGSMEPWKFYDLRQAVKPTVYDFGTTRDFVAHMDDLRLAGALRPARDTAGSRSRPSRSPSIRWSSTPSSRPTASAVGSGCRSSRRTGR